MTTKQLIAKLQELDPDGDMNVIGYDDSQTYINPRPQVTVVDNEYDDYILKAIKRLLNIDIKLNEKYISI